MRKAVAATIRRSFQHQPGVGGILCQDKGTDRVSHLGITEIVNVIAWAPHLPTDNQSVKHFGLPSAAALPCDHAMCLSASSKAARDLRQSFLVGVYAEGTHSTQQISLSGTTSPPQAKPPTIPCFLPPPPCLPVYSSKIQSQCHSLGGILGWSLWNVSCCLS